MDDFSIGTISLLVSNILLSSYPILIKNYVLSVDTLTQLIIRCVVYILLAIPFMILNKETIGIFTNLVQPKFLLISLVNLIHIYTSYKGFELLNPGVALSTFYTYPIIQLVLSKIYLGTQFNSNIFYNLFGSLLGVIILNKQLFTTINILDRTTLGKGLLFILGAALTESIINIFYKKVNIQNPFTSLYTLYAPSFIIYLLYIWFKHNGQIKKIFTIDKSILKKVILFNILIGGIGYTLRLFSLNKISMSWFSSLSFTNSISVFVLGWLLLGEKIKLEHIIGTAIIFYNIHKIRTLV